MSRLCPEYDPSRALIEPLLYQVDCRLENYVEAGHQGLFGQYGNLNGVLTTVFTILIALYGFRLLLGNGRLRVSDISIKMVLIGIVVMVTTDWEMYHLLIFDVFYHSGNGLAVMLGDFIGSNARGNVAATLDDILTRGMRVLPGLQADTQPLQNPAQLPPARPDGTDANQSIAAQILPFGPTVLLLWASLLMITLFSAGSLVVSKILLGVLLVIGPLSALLLLFSFTRDLFMGWLRLITIFAAVPLFVILFSYGLAEVVVPILTQLETQPLQDNQKLQLTLALLLVSVIFSTLVSLSFFACNALTAGWHWPKSDIATTDPIGNASLLDNLLADQSSSSSRINGIISGISHQHVTPPASPSTASRQLVIAPAAMPANMNGGSLYGPPQRHSSIANAFRMDQRTGA